MRTPKTLLIWAVVISVAWANSVFAGPCGDLPCPEPSPTPTPEPICTPPCWTFHPVAPDSTNNFRAIVDRKVQRHALLVSPTLGVKDTTQLSAYVAKSGGGKSTMGYLRDDIGCVVTMPSLGGGKLVGVPYTTSSELIASRDQMTVMCVRIGEPVVALVKDKKMIAISMLEERKVLARSPGK